MRETIFIKKIYFHHCLRYKARIRRQVKCSGTCDEIWDYSKGLFMCRNGFESFFNDIASEASNHFFKYMATLAYAEIIVLIDHDLQLEMVIKKRWLSLTNSIFTNFRVIFWLSWI